MTLELAFQNQDAEVLQDRLVFDGHFKLRQLSLRHRLFKGGWGPVIQRELFDRGDAIAVLPIDMEREELILIEQFRPGALNRESSPWMLELIAGVIEEAEDDRAVAHREAEEEAQCRMDELQLIATFFPSAGACSEQIRCFVGRVVSAPDTGLFGLDSEHEDGLPLACETRHRRDHTLAHGRQRLCLPPCPSTLASATDRRYRTHYGNTRVSPQ